MILRRVLSSCRSGCEQVTLAVVRYCRRLEGKLVGLFLLLSLVPLTLVAALAIHSGTKALELHIGAQLEVQSRHVMDFADDYLAAIRGSLQTWAGMPVMSDVVGDDPDGRITRMLIALENGGSGLGSLSVTSRSGKIVASSDTRAIGESVADMQWFHRAARRFAEPPGNDPFDVQPADGGFRITLPLKTEIKGLSQLGYLSAHVTKSRLETLLRAAQRDQDPTVRLYLTSGMHDAITSVESKKGIGESATELLSVLNARSIEPAGSRSDGWDMIALPGSGPLLVGYARSQRFPMMGWRVVVVQDSATAFSAVWTLRQQIVVLGAFIAVLVAGLAMLVANRAGRPIRVLMYNAERVASGDLDTDNLPLDRQDEIGSLAWAFQTMTEKLRAFTESLEQQVKERTAELHDSNARLRESEERFRLLVEQVQDYAIIFLDPDGRVVTWNAGAQRLNGYDAEEIRGRHVGCFYTTEDLDAGKPEALLERARRTGHASDEGWRVRQDGSLFWADVVLTALRDESGRLRGFAKVTRDITERKRTQDELGESRAQLELRTKRLEQSNQELEQFAYVASHDLAEPLRMVSGFCALLKKRYEGRLDKDADEFITYAVDGATRMQRLLQDLLTVSRVASRQQPVQEVETERVFAEMLDNLRVSIRQHGAEVTHGALPVVMADRTQMLQVFQNLVGNAIKYHGSAPPRIHCDAVRQNGEWIFSVRDNGIGFEQKHADRIFIIFQRLHNKTEYPGTGVGLSICKKIVERHGGRIWAESTPGSGSTFSFTLPA